jgi:hypothetical protein
VKDSEKFFGVIALEVTGQDDSTRTASVQPSVAGGGAISRLRFGPRTIVVRGLAVAADDCGMEVGLNFLRCQYETTVNDCGRDLLWFLSCCPDCVGNPNSPAVGPCWADTYDQLGPGSPPAECPPGTWWPETYQQLVDGPPDTTQWCRWVDNYRELRDGLPQFGCDVADCLVPTLRNFQGVRVTSGPTVLSRRSMSGGGEIAEIEFTIACADPVIYTPIEVYRSEMLEPGDPFIDPTPLPGPSNPFKAPALPVSPNPARLPLPAEWRRTVLTFTPERRTDLTGMAPSISLAATADMGVVRVGVWRDSDLLGGFMLPFVPANGLVNVNAVTHQTITEYDGEVLPRNGFARNYRGQASVKWPELVPDVEYTITIDQDASMAVPFAFELAGAEKGCA